MNKTTMNGHIMIVEDEAVHRVLTEEILLNLGLKVTSVDNGFAALNHLEINPSAFDLIIMDWEMPDMDGLETARKIRALQVKEGLQHIPILAFTSNKHDGDMEKCIAAGMDDYLPKEIFLPKWQPLLLEKLEKWLSFDGNTSQAKSEA